MRAPVSSPAAWLPQPTRETLVAAVVAAGGAVVLLLWWRDTAAGSVHTLAAGLTAAGRITGLLGSYLVLVEVLLMARLPWLDGLIGTDRLAVWHRRNGEYSISLLVAHAVLTIWGYGLTDHAGPLSETRTVLTYPDMITATVGMGILVLIGVLSARAVRSRMNYQLWYYLHLGTYVALALSFGHQLATGADFIGHPVNRGIWIGMYTLVAALIVGFRVLVPVIDAVTHELRVAQVVPEADGVVSIYVTGQRLEELNAEPGQFFYWRFLTGHGWWQAHPFSLSAAPNGRWLRLTVKALGDHSGRLQYLRPGTRVIAEGPYGAFTRHRRTRRKVLLVGGGVGMAPLRALFESLPAGPGDLTLLYRATSEDELLFRGEIEELARRRGARVRYVLGSRHQQPDPLGPKSLHQMVPHLRDHDVFVCGPPGLTAGVIANLRAAGVSGRHIHTEGFEL